MGLFRTIRKTLKSENEVNEAINLAELIEEKSEKLSKDLMENLPVDRAKSEIKKCVDNVEASLNIDLPDEELKPIAKELFNAVVEGKRTGEIKRYFAKEMTKKKLLKAGINIASQIIYMAIEWFLFKRKGA